MDKSQTEILDSLNGSRTSATKAKTIIGALLAVCDLAAPTLERKGQGAYYFDYQADALRSMLDKRDTDIYQASQILGLLSDKVMDLDSLLGNIMGTLGSSIDYLTGIAQKEANHD